MRTNETQKGSTLGTRGSADLSSPGELRGFETYLAKFQDAYVEHSADYTSVPITSGKRLFLTLRNLSMPLSRFESPLPPEIQTREVTAPNITDAAAAIRECNSSTAIINPTTVYVEGATQDQYRGFWRKIIKERVARIIPLLDWPYSFGCLYEVRFGLEVGIPVCLCDSTHLKMKEIEQAIRSADNEVASLGFSDEPLWRYWEQCASQGL